ncbi:hypothetical protein KR044_002066, partial [Drosophila immigrans]
RNLRQIFEDDDKPLQSETNNLHYQPQKTQPTTTSATASNSSTKAAADPKAMEKWSTLVAKVANGYNGSECVGRVGVALSRNGVGAAKVVVYKSRSQLLSTLLLTKSTTSAMPRDGASQVILRANYMQFYDDDQRFWSLRFEASADEAEFTEALMSVGLPIEQMREEAQKKAKEGLEQASTSTAARQKALPQALPRLKRSQAPQQQLEAAAEEETSSCDSESESTEDNLQSSHRSLLSSKALVPATMATTSSSGCSVSSELVTRNKLEVYLQEQRLNGQAMDKKMDSILQAMCRLTVQQSAQLSEIETTRDVKHRNHKEDAAQTAVTDNEDELLELEQKLLDFKKQNRVLVKSLKQREQALADLRSSNCGLCEELLNQNNELKKQNNALLSALAAKVQANTAQNTSISLSADNCQQCDKHLEKIVELEKRVHVLQSVLLEYPKGSLTTSSVASS